MKKNTSKPLVFVAVTCATFCLCGQVGVADTLDSTTLIWTGAADSTWGNAANWNLNRLPDASDYIGMGSGSPQTLVISNTAAGDLAYDIGGASVTSSTGDYNISLQGTSDGLAILNVAGGGFYSVNNSVNDLAYNIVLNDHSRLVFTGGNDAAAYPAIKNAPSRATLWGVDIAMHGNATADFTASTAGSVLLNSLDMDAGTAIATGTSTLNISLTSNIAGTITNSRTSGEALRFNSRGTGHITTIASSGVVNLSGNSYALLRYGTLQVDGVFNGSIRQQSGAGTVIGGAGYIIGNITSNASSAIAPGSSTQAGALTISGSVTMSDATAININLFTTTQMDELVINGTLDLAASGTGAGINLGVTRDEANFVVRNGRYKVITVNGDLLGSFNPGLINNFGPLAPGSYWEIVAIPGGSEVYINIVRGSFSSATGLTPNQYVIAGALDNIGSAMPDQLIMAIDSQKSTLAYGKVLNQLGPQSYQAWYSAAVTQTVTLGAAIENRLAVPDEKLREARKFDIYVQASRGTARKDATEANEYYEINPEQVLTGLDYAFSPAFLVGALYAHDRTDYTLDDSGSRGESKSNTVGGYARYRAGAFQATALLYYGTDSYTANRSVGMTDLGTFATADTDGTRHGGRALVSYTLNPAWFDVVPTLGLQYVKWEADGFTEAGEAGATTLVVAKQDAESVLGTLGLRIARSFDILKGNAVLRPFLNVHWAFRMNSDDRYISAIVMDEAITVKTAQGKRNGWRVEGGVSLDYYSGLSLFASYGNDSNIAVDRNIAVRGGVGYRF